MKTKTITIYSFQELSEDAKENAMQYMRENWQLGEECLGEGMDTINKGLAAFNAQLNIYSIDFTGNYRSRYSIEMHDNELTGLKLRTYLLNYFYSNFFRKKVYKLNEKKRVSRIKYVESDCPFTGMCYDESFMDIFRNFIKSPSENVTFEDLLKDAVEKVIKEVGSEIEYRNGEESIAEMCEANEYEFDESGKII